MNDLNPEYQVTKAEQLVSFIQKQTIPSNPVVFVALKAQLSSIITGALASVTWTSYDYTMVSYPLGDDPNAVLVNLTVVK